MTNRFEELFEEADDAFDGKYGKELKQLHALDEDQIISITPDTEYFKVYSVLLKVVEDASKKNLSQAQLASNIRNIGKLGVEMAKKVPTLAALLI